ncbi:MAG: hypothetical protein M1824_006279 [Vezdaea acicularis]|nr:MAG: hypothetical protein M1824_006279 [Vezdaea acicularis]
MPAQPTRSWSSKGSSAPPLTLKRQKSRSQSMQAGTQVVAERAIKQNERKTQRKTVRWEEGQLANVAARYRQQESGQGDSTPIDPTTPWRKSPLASPPVSGETGEKNGKRTTSLNGTSRMDIRELFMERPADVWHRSPPQVPERMEENKEGRSTSMSSDTLKVGLPVSPIERPQGPGRTSQSQLASAMGKLERSNRVASIRRASKVDSRELSDLLAAARRASQNRLSPPVEPIQRPRSPRRIHRRPIPSVSAAENLDESYFDDALVSSFQSALPPQSHYMSSGPYIPYNPTPAASGPSSTASTPPLSYHAFPSPPMTMPPHSSTSSFSTISGPPSPPTPSAAELAPLIYPLPLKPKPRAPPMPTEPSFNVPATVHPEEPPFSVIEPPLFNDQVLNTTNAAAATTPPSPPPPIPPLRSRHRSFHLPSLRTSSGSPTPPVPELPSVLQLPRLTSPTEPNSPLPLPDDIEDLIKSLLDAVPGGDEQADAAQRARDAEESKRGSDPERSGFWKMVREELWVDDVEADADAVDAWAAGKPLQGVSKIGVV